MDKARGKARIKEVLGSVLIAYLLISLSFAIFFFTTGFHDLDQSRNILKISYNEKSDVYTRFQDKGLDGKVSTYDDWYYLGSRKIFAGFFILVLNCLVMLLPYLRPYTINQISLIKSKDKE